MKIPLTDAIIIAVSKLVDDAQTEKRFDKVVFRLFRSSYSEKGKV